MRFCKPATKLHRKTPVRFTDVKCSSKLAWLTVDSSYNAHCAGFASLSKAFSGNCVKEKLLSCNTTVFTNGSRAQRLEKMTS